MFGRTTVLIALALALALPASAPARQAVNSPTGLKAFLLSYGEPAKRTFTRTPSFGWKPVTGAISYDFQLATSTTFRENSIVWSNDGLMTPYTAVSIALPWITGNHYSLFARVRAHTRNRATPWSADFGFSVRGEKPTQLSAPNGLLRWTPVDGATAYEVWEKNIAGNSATEIDNKTYVVATNVTDMRDWFTFHQDQSWVGNAQWRVRAVRELNGSTTNDSLPITTYGPWSSLFTTHASTPTATTVALGETVSNTVGTISNPVAHSLMPGFSWSGSRTSGGEQNELYRAYVYSDEDCVNPVMTGSVVGSPAWVPRLSGALLLPGSLADLAASRGKVSLLDGVQGGAVYNWYEAAIPAETGASTDTLDLWDRNWPSGVYYWTVVPVEILQKPDGTLYYRDAELPQDVCDSGSGRIGTFGRVGNPVETANNKAFITTLALAGKVKSVAASTVPGVYGNTPLVTWSPVLSADKYEVQWSRRHYPFVAAGDAVTQATSATLPLAPGVWYYRVRGIDLQVVKAQSMGWSSVRKLKILKPTFRISR
jgi:hypothetical protein